MSTEVIDLDPAAGPGLALDERHTLVAVEPQDLEAIWRPDADGALGWLLFRSGPAGRSLGVRVDGRPPDLWFEVGGRRITGELRESAGWGEPGAAAVALFEVLAEVAPTEPRASSPPPTCGIQLGAQEVVVELPVRWRERLGPVASR